jgi:hypothetical protein
VEREHFGKLYVTLVWNENILGKLSVALVWNENILGKLYVALVWNENSVGKSYVAPVWNENIVGKLSVCVDREHVVLSKINKSFENCIKIYNFRINPGICKWYFDIIFYKSGNLGTAR